MEWHERESRNYSYMAPSLRRVIMGAQLLLALLLCVPI
jgi:hypothetical protein